MKYEVFCDIAYFDMWAVRPVGEGRWGACYHLPSEGEAMGLAQQLEKLESERDEAIQGKEVALKSAHIYDEAHTKALEGWAQAERERDEARQSRLSLLNAAKNLHDILWDNVGDTADYPIEIKGDCEETVGRLIAALNVLRNEIGGSK